MNAGARAATAGLLALPAHDFDDEVTVRLEARLEAGIADAVAGLTSGGAIEVGLAMLRWARYQPERLGLPDEPFTWKPAFVRRSLGLELVRVCAERTFPGPAAAVESVADRAVDEWRRTGCRTFHWEPWLAGLGTGARAVVLADAVTWATPVWATFDWPSLAGSAVLGGPYDRWSGPESVVLRGRSEARIGLPTGRPTLLSVASGGPGDGWRSEMAFMALVAVLAAPGRPAPARVVGLWPDAGYRLAVEIDEAALFDAVDCVIDAVAVTAEVRASHPGTDVADVCKGAAVADVA